MTIESSIETSVAPSAPSSVPSPLLTSAPLFDEVADELYANPPRAFAALRTQRAQLARAAGAPDVAARIDKLRVPCAAAWMSNQLVRHFRGQVLVLLELGRALQVATGTLDTNTLNANTLNANTLNANTLNTGTLDTGTLDGHALHRLNDRRRDVYNELHRRAAWLAVEERVTAGRPALRGLGDSLHSAMCNERMAQEMLAGRLVRSLPRIAWPGLTPDRFPDELARRRALRVARGLERRPSRYATDDEDRDDEDRYDAYQSDAYKYDGDNAPLATVTRLPDRIR